MNTPSGLSWSFTAKTLVAVLIFNQAIVQPILNKSSPSGSLKSPLPTLTNLRWFRTKLWGSRPIAIKRPRCPTSEPRLESSSWGHEGAPGTVCTTVLCKRPPTHAPQPRLCQTPPPSRSPPPQGYPPGLVQRLQRPSCHLWWRPAYTLTRPIPCPDSSYEARWLGRPFGLWLPTRSSGLLSPPVDPAKQLLPLFYRCSLFKIRSGNFLRLQTYRHYIVRSTTPHALTSTPLTTRWLTSSAVELHIEWIWPLAICWRHPSS